jgi:hypothetical protein
MNHALKVSFITMMIFLSAVLSSLSLFSQHFDVLAYFGAGQASGGIDTKEFAFTSQIGTSFETKSEIISVSAALKTEAYNFIEEADLMVFSLPIGCEIHTRTNPKPYFGVSIGPSYPTQWVIERYLFLTGGLTGGVMYNFQKLSAFAQFEYLAGLTKYADVEYGVPSYEVDKYYLDRYYISLGIKVQL